MKPRLEMKLGADPKKTAILIGLSILAAYLIYSNVFSEPELPPGAKASRPVAKSPSILKKDLPDEEALTARKPQNAGKSTTPKEFRPSLLPKKGEERSAADIDPTLRLDLLAKLAAVKIDRVDRSLFDFGNVEVVRPKLPEPIIPVKQAVARRPIGPELPPPPPPPAVKPPPPPIPLKFYGSALPIRGGTKRVFCMQGEEILAPSEGEVIQRRYRIIRINATSVVVEDLDYKHQQTIQIEEAQHG
ncbi:hypothetical protein [uncultured Paludibaculum sp.]|uniref:hypothetical protein n=1 Tax=uncultured Paludibaculum sp. TaxID=1765020 RepID=UPI002AAC04A6|nr:hypothetical protein [uncultured Paludibaculum sp.]